MLCVYVELHRGKNFIFIFIPLRLQKDRSQTIGKMDYPMVDILDKTSVWRYDSDLQYEEKFLFIEEIG